MTNAKTLRKAKKDAKGNYALLFKLFSLRAFSTPLRLCVKYFFGLEKRFCSD